MSLAVNVITFLNEFELLKLRLEMLKDLVDQFVIIEAETTFSGHSKPLYFKEANQYGYDFSSYNISHVVLKEHTCLTVVTLG